MDAHKKAVFAFQFWSVKCTTATVRYAEISSIFIPSHQVFSSGNASDSNDQNAFKRIYHYIYLFKLHGISIILLLKIT